MAIMRNLSVVGFLLSATPVFSQTLNRWSQTVFGVGGSPGHWADDAFDNNLDTYALGTSLPGSISILLNRWETFLGFYVQSSGAYVTDYHVEAWDSANSFNGIVGRVSGATSNFTAINFWNSLGQQGITSNTLWLTVTGVQTKETGPYSNTTANSTFSIVEIYPIYRGDTIVYPPGQSASPSPTQTFVNPTPTPTPTPPLPSAPGLVLNAWPISGSTKPIPIGGSNSANLVDGKTSTGSSTDLITNLGYPGSYTLLFNGIATYAGLYILTESPSYLTNYHVVAQNTTTYQTFEVCRVIGATSNFTACPFVNEKGDPFYNTAYISIYPESVSGGGGSVKIQDIWPIWPGDKIVNL